MDLQYEICALIYLCLSSHAYLFIIQLIMHVHDTKASQNHKMFFVIWRRFGIYEILRQTHTVCPSFLHELLVGENFVGFVTDGGAEIFHCSGASQHTLDGRSHDLVELGP